MVRSTFFACADLTVMYTCSAGHYIYLTAASVSALNHKSMNCSALCSACLLTALDASSPCGSMLTQFGYRLANNGISLIINFIGLQAALAACVLTGRYDVNAALSLVLISLSLLSHPLSPSPTLPISPFPLTLPQLSLSLSLSLSQ